MPITVEEKFESRFSSTGDNPSVELDYVVSGTDDDVAAKGALESTAPPYYDGLIRLGVSVEPVGTELWNGRVRYGLRQSNPPTNSSTFSFDTTGGTQHITQSIETVGAYSNLGFVPDNHGAIGVTHDSVEGVDITVPIYQFSETHYMPTSIVTPEYRRTVFLLTGKVNDAPFGPTEAGECLFLGASGTLRTAGDEGDWEITYKFACSPNEMNFKVGDITIDSKKGWEYMWVRYEDSEDSNTIVKKPVAVYIEKVYRDGDFSLLGL